MEQNISRLRNMPLPLTRARFSPVFSIEVLLPCEKAALYRYPRVLVHFYYNIYAATRYGTESRIAAKERAQFHCSLILAINHDYKMVVMARRKSARQKRTARRRSCTRARPPRGPLGFRIPVMFCVVKIPIGRPCAGNAAERIAEIVDTLDTGRCCWRIEKKIRSR